MDCDPRVANFDGRIAVAGADDVRCDEVVVGGDGDIDGDWGRACGGWVVENFDVTDESITCGVGYIRLAGDVKTAHHLGTPSDILAGDCGGYRGKCAGTDGEHEACVEGVSGAACNDLSSVSERPDFPITVCEGVGDGGVALGLGFVGCKGGPQEAHTECGERGDREGGSPGEGRQGGGWHDKTPNQWG